MARKPSDLVQPNLRIREELRRRLEREAKKRGVSLNAEMTSRLERSFDGDAARSNEEIAEDMKNVWARYGEMFHGLNWQGDLIRAASALLKQIDAGNSGAIGAAAAKVKRVIDSIEREAAALPAKMHTTGGE
jgi:hypothetical protein